MKTGIKVLGVLGLVLSAALHAANESIWMANRYAVMVKYVDVLGEYRDAPFPKDVQMPTFPVEMLKCGRQGDVEISFDVQRDGVVASLVIEKAETGDFAGAAERAVCQWAFRPALAGPAGKPTSVRMRCQIQFRILSYDEPTEQNGRSKDVMP